MTKIKKIEIKPSDIIHNKQIEPLEGEVFREYPLNTLYMVSNLGRVKSKDKAIKHNYGGIAIRKGAILTQTDNGSGYLSVGLTSNRKTRTTRVNRMVAITFIDNPINKPQVNHINGDKYDNRSYNLEWCTPSENIVHAWNIGLSNKRKSFIYIKDRLASINNYIAYSPRVSTPLGFGTIIIDQASYRIIYDNGRIENLVKSLRQWKDDLKLVLKPISDLYKEINGEVGIGAIGKMFEPNGVLYCEDDTWTYGWNTHVCDDYQGYEIGWIEEVGWFGIFFDTYDFENQSENFTGDYIPYSRNIAEYLDKNLFDWRYNLLEQGLAINKNDIE